MNNWFSSTIQSIREKSVDALDFVYRDLSEFTTTVKNDTESYLNKIKSQETADLGINKFLSKSNDTVKTNNDSGKHIQASTSFDRMRNELTRIQNDESTYLTDPTSIESYENWRKTTDFDVDKHKGEIAQLLIDAPHVRSFYAHLVPAQTTHYDFWSRYYYRVHQIEEEEARRTQLIKRAHEICSETSENKEHNNENDWDEPDDEWSKETPKVTEEKIVKSESTNERKESDTVSGDSWEREFDETDLAAATTTNQTKSNDDLLTKSEETVTSESLSSTKTTTNKQNENELDEDWDSWS